MKKTIEQKREKRVKATAEVFTPLSLCLDMLNKLPKELWFNPKATFLEPSCGDGMFVENIILKKLQMNHDIEDVILSIHARDIMKDNIEICRSKVLVIIKEELKKRQLKKKDYINKMIDLCAIVLYNIRVTPDTLKENFDKLIPWNEKQDKNYIKNAKPFLMKRKYI